MTMIIDAINKGDISKVLELLRDPKLQSNIAAKENYALRLAVLHGHLDIVKVLLGYQAVRDNIAAEDNWVLKRAAENGHLDVVKKLLKYPAVRNNIAARNNWALASAACNGHLDVVKVLIGYQVVVDDIAAWENKALILAARYGHLEVVKVFLGYQAVVDDMAEDNFAFIWAAKNGHLDVVKVMLEYQALKDNIAVDDNFAFRLAAKNGHLDVVKVLLEYPAVVDNIAARKNEALIYAAENGHLDVVMELLKYPAVRNDIAANRNAALRLAAKNGHHLVCYVVAEKCWGNMGNVPQDLKNHRDWPKVIKSIRQGASEHAHEAYRAYYLDKICEGVAGREVNKDVPEVLQRRIEEYISSTSKGLGDKVKRVVMKIRIKSKLFQGLKDRVIGISMRKSLLNQGLFQRAMYDGRSYNVQARRMFDNEYGLVLWSRSKQGVDHYLNAESLERIDLSINKSLFNLRTGS